MKSGNRKGVTEMVEACASIVPELMEPNINDVNKWLSQRLSKENTKKIEVLTGKQEGIVKMWQGQRSQHLKKDKKKLAS